MTYTNAQAREQMLESIRQAIQELGMALASLGEAYEQLDEQSAERLEGELFRPVQLAYGRMKRTYTEFAARHDLPSPAFEAAPAGAPSKGVKGFLDSAVEAVGKADATLSTLQDSMLPIEVGDPELRAGLEDVRKLLGDLRPRARELVRTLGR
jgi:DNA-binding transcriptional MocR family regulator